MTTFELGGGKQVIVGSDRIKVWAHGGGLGVNLTPEQLQEIGLTMWLLGRARRRSSRVQSRESDVQR